MARPPVHHLVGEIYGRNRIVAKPIVSNFVEASTIADDVAPPPFAKRKRGSTSRRCGRNMLATTYTHPRLH